MKWKIGCRPLLDLSWCAEFLIDNNSFCGNHLELLAIMDRRSSSIFIVQRDDFLNEKLKREIVMKKVFV